MDREPSRRVTAHDVARLAGVSQTTVSLVYRDAASGARIPEATQERVRAAGAELGYVPNHVARSLRSDRTNLIGLATTLNAMSALQGIRAARETARQAGRQLLVLPGDDEAALLQALDLAARGMLDAIILCPTTKAVEDKALTVADAGRTVVATSLPRRTRLTVVEPDLKSAGQLAADHLWTLGHRSVVLAGPSTGADDARFSAFLAEWGRRGGTATLHLSGRGGADDGRTAGRTLATSTGPGLATAVFGFNDDYAMGVVAGLSEQGLQVPTDVSVMGCDNAPMAPFLQPSLTTIDLDSSGLMGKAVQLVTEALDGAPAPRRKRHRVAATLVARGSTSTAAS